MSASGGAVRKVSASGAVRLDDEESSDVPYTSSEEEEAELFLIKDGESDGEGSSEGGGGGEADDGDEISKGKGMAEKAIGKVGGSMEKAADKVRGVGASIKEKMASSVGVNAGALGFLSDSLKATKPTLKEEIERLRWQVRSEESEVRSEQ